MTRCRCGYNGQGEHPCHGALYTCTRPGTRRLYMLDLTPIGSTNPACKKLEVQETYACDECWKEYNA